MNDLIKAAIAAGAVCFAMPAFAQDASTMTCEDFMALDEAGQQEAMATMQSDAAAAGTATTGTDTTATTDATADSDAMMEEQMASMMAACEADPSMMAMDAMNADG